MNRRSFLKFCGIAPVVPQIAITALSENPVILVNHNTPGIDPNILMPNYIIGEAWSNDQSDPISDIIKACKTIKSHTGRFPPMYAISKENYERLNI